MLDAMIQPNAVLARCTPFERTQRHLPIPLINGTMNVQW